MTRRVAVFGGTFDPPHIGHLVVANEVLHRLDFDEVLLVVANDPYQKSATREVSDPLVRLEMVTAAIDGREGLVPSDIEILRGGSSYTIETIESLLGSTPDTEFSLVIGSDAVATLDSWHRAEDLRSMTKIVAIDRPGVDFDDRVAHGANDESNAESENSANPWRIEILKVPSIDISSTEIRDRCEHGVSIDYLVADGVRSVIERHGLYGVRR